MSSRKTYVHGRYSETIPERAGAHAPSAASTSEEEGSLYRAGHVHDWSQDGEGESLLDTGVTGRSPDLHSWIRNRLHAFEFFVESWAQGEYGNVHNWETDREGEALFATGASSGSPDLHAWLRDRRDAFDSLLEKYSGENLRKLGQTADGLFHQEDPSRLAILLNEQQMHGHTWRAFISCFGLNVLDSRTTCRGFLSVLRPTNLI
jgi:hypothetical protein